MDVPRRARSRLNLALLALTAGYLAIEIPFGALLIDAASSPDAATTERLEEVGRLIAGCALALALLPFLVLKPDLARGVPAGQMIRRAAFVSLLIVGGAFYAQRALIDWIADGSSPAIRRAAVQAAAIRSAVASPSARIAGLPTGDPNAPDRRAFAMLAPLTALLRPGAIDDAGGLPALILAQVRAEKADDIAKARDAYKTALASYENVASGAPAAARKASATAWDDWYKWINQRTWGLATKWGIHEADAKNYRRIARERGVPVADDWYPLDADGFRAAFEKAFMQKTGAKLMETDPHRLFPDGPPTELSVRDRMVRDATAPPGAFADGEAQAETGKTAVRTLVVPAIALALSLSGLLVHLWKSAYFLWAFSSPPAKYTLAFALRRGASIGAVLGLAVLGLRDAGNPVTGSAFWRQSTAAMSTSLGATAATAATLVVEMQPAVYPVASRLASAPHFSWIARFVAPGGTPAAPGLIADASSRSRS